MRISLDYEEMIPVNGDRQSVRIRSADAEHPVMLFLHGGPGVCNRHLVLRHNGALADRFALVCWDQRASGKSFRPEQLRQSLTPEQYVEDKYYSRNENELATFEQRGKGTIDLALENPNLFRFLYMGERSQLLSTGFELQTNNQDVVNMYQEMAELLGITLKQVMDFAMTMMVYTQGIGTLIASGIVKDTKENMYHMLHNTGMTYLKGLGVKDSTLWDLSGGDRSDESSSNG